MGEAHLARVDGEDFAVLQPVADMDEAAELAETLRAGIETLMPEVAAKTVHVTASVGVSLCAKMPVAARKPSPPR